MCGLWSELGKNAAPQISVKWFLTGYVDMHALRCDFWENVAPQISQWKGFLPVCGDMCLLKCELWEYLAS